MVVPQLAVHGLSRARVVSTVRVASQSPRVSHAGWHVRHRPRTRIRRWGPRARVGCNACRRGGCARPTDTNIPAAPSRGAAHYGVNRPTTRKLNCHPPAARPNTYHNAAHSLDSPRTPQAHNTSWHNHRRTGLRRSARIGRDTYRDTRTHAHTHTPPHTQRRARVRAHARTHTPSVSLSHTHLGCGPLPSCRVLPAPSTDRV